MDLVALGLYKNSAGLNQCLEQLKNAGFTKEAVSVVFPQSSGTVEERQAVAHNVTDASTTGAETGAVIGGALGLLAGAGVLAFPGLGAFVVGGPIGTALIGSTLAGGIGTLIGSFVGLGASADEVRVYEERLKKGEALASVHCADQTELHKAEKVLADSGAERIYFKN